MKTPTGRYRIQAVAETTGVPAATLRQWERRYGVPSPDRTASSYRVYSDADVEDIQRMQALAATGVSPSEAARIITAERAAAERPTRGDADAAPPTAGATVDDVDPYLDLRRRLLTAIEGYDHATLASTCRRLLYMDGATTLFERVVAPVMREVGQRWHQGTLTVAQEHLASEAIGQVVRQLLPVVQPPDDAPTALLACFRDELHTLPLYGVAFRLAHARHRTVVLGARTPPDALAAAVARIEPTLVGLSTTVAPPIDTAQVLVEAYAAACGDVPWVVGGRGARAIEPLVIAAGGHLAESDPSALPTQLDRLTKSARRRSG